MVHRDDLRRALVERVSRDVGGVGIARPAIESAVDGVVAVLADAGRDGSAPAGAELVAVLSAPSRPDLASRASAALAAEGVAVAGIGRATTGRHTVVALRLPAAARPALERAAAAIGAALSLLPAREVA